MKEDETEVDGTETDEVVESEIKPEVDPEVEPEVDPEVEPQVARASKSGWVSKDEWIAAGKDADQWRSADEFNRVGDSIGVVHRKEMDEARDEISALRRSLKALSGTVTKARQAGYTSAIKDIEVRQRAAVADGDTASFDAAIRERKTLEKQIASDRIAAEGDPGAEEPAEVTDWLKANKWFNKDPELRLSAVGALDKIQANHPAMRLSEQLDKVTERMRTRFPEEFGVTQAETTTRRKAPTIEGGTNTIRQPSGKSFSSIPAADRKLANDLFKDGTFDEHPVTGEALKTAGARQAVYAEMYFAEEQNQ
jgi:hypothetical protein